MRIAYVLKRFPELSQTFVLNEILELQRRGYQVTVLSQWRPAAEPVPPGVAELKGNIHYLGAGVGALLIAHFWLAVRRPFHYFATGLFVLGLRRREGVELFWQGAPLALCCRRLAIQHFHAHFAWSSTTLAMLLARLLGKPYSFTVHAVDIFVDPLLLPEKMRHAAFVVAISHYNRDHLLRLGPTISPDKVKVIHCGVEPDRRRVVHNGRPDRATILSVGRLVPKKGFRYLIQACQVLSDRGRDYRCLIVGEGEERAELESLVGQLGLAGRVKLLGAIPHDEVLGLMQDADLFVLPCTTDPSGDRDGIPVVLMEAMAHGLPVISTAISGIPELVMEGAGVLVPPADAAALGAAIEGLLADREAARRMGAAGREVVSRDFDLHQEVGKLADLFQQAGHSRPERMGNLRTGYSGPCE